MFLKCFEVFLVVCFCTFSLDSVRIEVFHPVWALYNIKEQAGHTPEPPPSDFLRWASLRFVVASSIVPGARVPNGHPWKKGYFVQMRISFHCKIRAFMCNSYLAQLSVSHCPCQAETKCSGNLGSGHSKEQPARG